MLDQKVVTWCLTIGKVAQIIPCLNLFVARPASCCCPPLCRGHRWLFVGCTACDTSRGSPADFCVDPPGSWPSGPPLRRHSSLSRQPAWSVSCEEIKPTRLPHIPDPVNAQCGCTRSCPLSSPGRRGGPWPASNLQVLELGSWHLLWVPQALSFHRRCLLFPSCELCA